MLVTFLFSFHFQRKTINGAYGTRRFFLCLAVPVDLKLSVRAERLRRLNHVPRDVVAGDQLRDIFYTKSTYA
jgi:hypothetical protein